MDLEAVTKKKWNPYLLEVAILHWRFFNYFVISWKKIFFFVDFQFCVISRKIFFENAEFYHLIFSASSCSNWTKSEVTVLSSFCFSLSGSQGKKVSRCKVSRSTNSQFQLTLKPFRLLAISSIYYYIPYDV